MAKKELVEQIKQSMPEGLNEIEITRFIYIYLGREKAFDTRYFYGNGRTRKKLYSLAQKTKGNTEEVAEKRTIICVSLSYLFQDILEEFGIKCTVVLDEDYDDRHIMPIVTLSNGAELKADLQLDLQNIQAGQSTNHFGVKYEMYNFYEIPKEELKQIDQKIGYIENDYRDEQIRKLRTDIDKMDAHQTLEYILLNPAIYKGVEMYGQVERRKYYNHILNTLAGAYRRKKIYMFTCYRQREDDTRDYSLCVYSWERDEIKPYVYSEKEERFLPISIEKLIELEEEGLVINPDTPREGTKLLHKYIEDYKDKKKEDEKGLARE